MHIEVTGSGPALVLIHGWALHGGIFAPLVEQLASDFQLHLVDLPGHGHSRQDPTPLGLPFVVNAIAAATPPAVWCGWSLGGLYALHAAATVPKVRGVAMIASVPRFTQGPGWPNAAPPTLFAQFADELARDYAGTIGRFLALDTGAGAQATATLRQLRDALLQRGQPDPGALQQALRLLADSDLRGALPALGKPGLWLAGQRDRLVQPAAMHAAAALAGTGHRALTLDGTGHAPFVSQPDVVAAQLRQFVAALG